MKPRNETKDIRVFAAGIGVILSVFSGISWYKTGTAWQWMLPVGLIFAAVGLIKPPLIRPVYKVWMKVAGFIAKVNTVVLLYLIYFLVLTPIGILMRLTGKDILDEKLNENAETYWHKKEEERAISRYTQQF